MIAAALAVAWLGEALWMGRWVLADSPPTSDPIVFFLSQGVLGVVCYLLYKEYRKKDDKLDAQNTKLIEDIIPLLTRATEVIERMAKAEELAAMRKRPT